MGSLLLRSGARAARGAKVVRLGQSAFICRDFGHTTSQERVEDPNSGGKRLCSGSDTITTAEPGFACRSFFHTSSPASDASTSGKGTGNGAGSAAEIEEKRRTINKILYRSRQRGLLELDLLMGKWAAQNVPSMDAEALDHYTTLLDEENPDLWKWLTEQAEPPADLQANPVFMSLCNYVRKDLEAKADPATRTEPGRAWVRGWDDGDRKVGGPPAGNQ